MAELPQQVDDLRKQFCSKCGHGSNLHYNKGIGACTLEACSCLRFLTSDPNAICDHCLHIRGNHINGGQCKDIDFNGYACRCESFAGSSSISIQHDAYLEILDEMRTLHIKKAADYGGGTGVDNLLASAEFGIEPWIGCVVRMNDKVTRIKSFIRNGKLENESIDDSLIDIAAYAILSLTLLRESRS